MIAHMNIIKYIHIVYLKLLGGFSFILALKGEEKLILEKVNDSNLCKNLEMGKYEINFIDFQNLLIDFKKFIFDVNSSLKL